MKISEETGQHLFVQFLSYWWIEVDDFVHHWEGKMMRITMHTVNFWSLKFIVVFASLKWTLENAAVFRLKKTNEHIRYDDWMHPSSYLALTDDVQYIVLEFLGKTAGKLREEDWYLLLFCMVFLLLPFHTVLIAMKMVRHSIKMLPIYHSKTLVKLKCQQWNVFLCLSVKTLVISVDHQ